MSETKFPELAFAKAITKAEALNTPKSILIYGDPKNGKTWLAASASEVAALSPVLLIGYRSRLERCRRSSRWNTPAVRLSY